MKIELTPQDLGVIFSMATQNFVDLAYGDLDKQEFAARCWLMAINSRLNLGLDINIEQRARVSLKEIKE